MVATWKDGDISLFFFSSNLSYVSESKHLICKQLFSLLLHMGASGLVPDTYNCCYLMLSVLLPSGQESGQHSRVQANLIWKMRCQHLYCCCAHSDPRVLEMEGTFDIKPSSIFCLYLFISAICGDTRVHTHVNTQKHAL